MMEEQKYIVIVSDGTGRTARRLMDAVLAQYAERDLDFSLVNIYQQVRDKQTIDNILAEIDDEYLVLYSIISRKLAKYFHERLAERNILHLSVLKPMLDIMSKFLGVHPEYRPGILQVIDDRYYRKVDAIGYTVEHDDGRGRLHGSAEIVLLGLSRTCKTPISMYLACNHGLKVANIPIVADDTITRNVLEMIKDVPPDRIVGLLMQPEVLMRVREERCRLLGQDLQSHPELDTYCDIREICNEFRYCRELYQTQNWLTVDVTRRAIEEVSTEIIECLKIVE
jgi:regulator of PEP synthase PpsR (kinase-PPPase family)